ncbi:unnamed protein product [Schistosoma mattheei]|uniref:Uncharacterized protein n=1 Tax=Schistosoma mattheei TaxID=31246 RepID=A0A183P1A3_9TREM|nr:unnamed protein product [Schistosoma mattheei]
MTTAISRSNNVILSYPGENYECRKTTRVTERQNRIERARRTKLRLLQLSVLLVKSAGGYSTDNSDSDQTNSYPLKEKSKLKKRIRRNHHRKRFGRMAKSWKFIKLRKLWERDMAKQR